MRCVWKPGNRTRNDKFLGNSIRGEMKMNKKILIAIIILFIIPLFPLAVLWSYQGAGPERDMWHNFLLTSTLICYIIEILAVLIFCLIKWTKTKLN